LHADIGHCAVDRGADGGAVEVEPGQIDRAGCLTQRAQDSTRAPLFDGFGGDDIGHRAIAAVLALGLGKGDLLARDWPGLFERQAIAGTVDDEEYVAAFDRLVVDDMHFADQARDIGRDRHGIGAHLAVAGYRFDLVADPEAIARRADKEDHEHW
jgi:hypothetical protein